MMVPNLTSTGSGGGIPGPPGKSVELQTTETAIQWRQTGGEWQDLVLLADITGTDGLDGKSVELRKTETAIQWRAGLDGVWVDLVLLADLVVGGGEGTIVSINGQTGPEVVLDADDVGAASAADLSALAGLLTELEAELSALDTEVDGKQTANASLAAIAAFSTAGSLQTRTARLNFPTSGGGAMYAFGRNGRNNGGQMQGLQVGGGVESDGIHGVYMAPDGHSSWMRLQPSRNYSPIEEVIYATGGQGFASKVNGTNTFTITGGSGGDATWIGEKFYWESEVYRVSAVSGNTVTVTTTAGGAVTLSGTASGVFHVFYVEATGTCTVSGSIVTRTSGDPFLPFVSDPSHRLQIGGVSKTVTTFTSTEAMTISSPPAGGTYTYRQRMDVDDTLVQLRLQKFFGSYEENLTFGAKPWGYFIRTQGVSASQGYRPLWIGSGEDMAQLALLPDGALRIGDHGRIRAPNTSTYNYLEVRGGGVGFSPNIRGRGPEENVGVNIDTQGGGEFNVTVNNFAASKIKASTAGVGFNGASPVGPTSVGPAATTSAGTTTLVNNIRAALIACGLLTA